MPNYQHKSTELLSVKASDDGRVEAVVSVMGVIDGGNDRVVPGAYLRTIQEDLARIKVLDGHQTRSVLNIAGRPLELRELSRDELPPTILERFPEATGGLLTVTQFNLNTTLGREIFQRIKDGDVTEYSIGYEPRVTETVTVEMDGKKRRCRDLKDIRLWEYSPVIWGMNPATTTVQVAADEVANGEAKGETVLLTQTLHAKLVSVFVESLTSWSEQGYLQAADVTDAIASGTPLLLELVNSLPDTVQSVMMEREMFTWSRPEDEEIKEGRVLSTVNVGRLTQARDLIQEVLDSAGNGEDVDEDGDKSTPTSAGHGDRPTRDQLFQRLVNLGGE